MNLQVNEYTNRLFNILDKDIAQLQYNISVLSELRTLILKQDYDSLGKLLESIRAKSPAYRQNELERKLICKQFAQIFGCLSEEVTLTKIGTLLADDLKEQTSARKNMLRSLAALLKKELSCTQILLADCARFNRRLLKTIMEAGQSNNLAYDTAGAAYRQVDNVFVNMQF